MTPARIVAERERTPAEEFAQLGEELHGASWTKPAARDLDLALRSVERMASGKMHVPGPILDAMRLMVESHRKAVAAARTVAKPGN